jgi:hypothetical protein
MTFFFEPRPGNRAEQDDDDAAAPGLTCVPAALLQRHGALMLNPADAAVLPDSGPPRATVYRAKTLLVPADLLRDPAFLAAADAALADIGLRLIPPASAAREQSTRPGAGVLQRLPRPAVLAPVPPADGRPAVPVTVDAWLALQTLRGAARARTHPALDEQTVRRIALEHLLIGSAITGSPATEGNGVTGTPATEGNGITGPTSTDSYVYPGGDTRAPVTVTLLAPERSALADCPSRRPVVAVLDTGVREHPWLDVLADPAGGYQTVGDGFVAVDHALQHAIWQGADQTAQAGDHPRQLIRHPWDTPVTADPLIGELDTDTGHGTFIAGIIRQVAPDAQVLAVRIMHSDGIVYEGDLICALALLAERIADAEAGDLAAMVDVVSLSLGYFDESSADVIYSSGLWQIIEALLELGVTVVAAAGNYSTSRRFYPAAFSLEPGGAGPVPLISVGALNPNGSKALFSDGGRWINAWASGAAMVSTFPIDINGKRCPQIRMRSHPDNAMPTGLALPPEREALDPDDYRGGFATWSGTSFAAPLLAAYIAQALLADAADPALSLDQPGAAAAASRTGAALADLGWQG